MALATSVAFAIVAARYVLAEKGTFPAEACRGTYLALRVPAKLVKNSTLKCIRDCGAGRIDAEDREV